MDGNRFDSLTRSFSTSRSRRSVLKGLGAAALGAVGLGRLGVEEADAAPCHKPNVKCGKGKEKICVDLSTDASNCGACDQSCPDGAICVDGGCVQTCAEGLDFCNGDCVDTSDDSANCGGCGVTCPGGGSCVDSGCICSSGYDDCNGNCVDTDNDSANCGACGNVCPGISACISGVCSCPVGQALCGGDCIPTTDDPDNCGSCGVTCPDGQSCDDGACHGGTPLVCGADDVCQSQCPGTTDTSCWCGTTFGDGNSVCYRSPGCAGSFCTSDSQCLEYGDTATCIFYAEGQGFCTRPSLACSTSDDCAPGFACVDKNGGCGGCDNYTGGLGICSQICTA